MPDVQAAKRLGARIMTRAELLAELFNAAPVSIAVGGTSGKSTTTGMIGWILHAAGRAPTIMNGAVMKNFITPDTPFASALVGKGEIFVSEVDESDGSIARYNPRIAVLNNVSLDHKSMDELRALFGGFVGRADKAVINLDNAEAAALARTLPPGKARTYSLADSNADLRAANLTPNAQGIRFDVFERLTGLASGVSLKAPGAHNVSNALAALSAALECGVSLNEAVAAIEAFSGIKRRLEVVGAAQGVTLIDDFAHNPDKIEATLKTLHAYPGRLIIFFQPHGFGPLKLMKESFISCFADNMGADDALIMPDPVYYGGTVDRAVGSADITEGVSAKGRTAFAFPDRAAAREKILQLARAGDRIIIMGARDDTLSEFAAELVAAISERALAKTA
ncbi:MAG: Mur ligase family protein [Hyphomonadaceae bacterium]